MEKREAGNLRASFVCTACEKFGKTVSFIRDVIVHDIDDKEMDEYVLIRDFVVPDERHHCQPNGVEAAVRQFRSQLIQQVRENPTKAMLYSFITYVFL